MAGMVQGAVDSLLGRLTSVLLDEAQLLGGVHGDVKFIKDEIESMNSLLLDLTEAQCRAHNVRTWMKQMFNFARDCEGQVELYVRRVGPADPRDSEGLLGYLRRIVRLLRTIPARHQIATQIRNLKVRAKDIGDRRGRHSPPAPPPDEARPAIIDKLALPWGKQDDDEDLRRRELLFSCDPPPDTVEVGTKQILHWLVEEPSCSVIIKGRGRVGKTAIAKSVYQHPSVVSTFELRAWVNFGEEDKGVDEVCSEIIQQLKIPYEVLYSGKDNRRILEEVLKSRQGGEKFMVVFDAVRPGYMGKLMLGYSVLDIPLIKNAIIVTTEHVTVNWYTGHIFDVFEFQTRPRFFRRRALDLAKSGLEPLLGVLEECYPDVFALQMLLHLLYINPNRSEGELNSLHELLVEHRNNIGNTMLMFCYKELPSNCKTCLLYLSIFPKGHRIRRTSLVRQWAAEGLITDRGITRGYDKGMQAESIFDALITQGFVRPGETSAEGKIKSCTVDHIIHEFTASEASFGDTCSSPDWAHRLSINSGIALQETLRHGRPFDDILTLIEYMPGSAQWKLVKVLDLEGCTGLKKNHLKNVCMIILLKYLSLRKTDVTELPRQIKELRCLETLDIRQTKVARLGNKAIVLPLLKHFLAGDKVTESNDARRSEESFSMVRMPVGIQRMRNMEILSHVQVSNSDSELAGIAQLLKLRKLGVVLHGKGAKLSDLFRQIEKLHRCLRSLSIRIDQPATSENHDEAILNALTPPKFIESLNISGITSGIPHLIQELHQLVKLTLTETYLKGDVFCFLGKLGGLRCLRLQHKSYIESELAFKEDEFQSLNFLLVEGNDVSNISFVIGTAPKLESIVWSFARMEALSGVNNLPKLKKLELNGECNLDPVRAAVEKHPNNPILKHNTHQEDGTVVAASASAP